MRRNERRRARAGVTLAELMITVAIIGILAMMVPPLMVGIQNFFLMTTARNNVQRDARASLDEINRFMRQGEISSFAIDTPVGQGPYSRVTFTMPDMRTVSFRQNGSELQETVSSGTITTNRTLARNLEYIAFSYPRTDDPSIISVALTMSEKIQLGQTKVLQLTVQKVRIMNP